MTRQKCTCVEQYGEDPGCVVHGKGSPEYARGYADGFAGRDRTPKDNVAYNDGYDAALVLVSALQNSGGKRSSDGYEFTFEGSIGTGDGNG